MANLTLSSISKSYGTAEVLDDISLDIKSGEFVVFVGPSGCGKSTLLKLIAGLEDASNGSIEIGGHDVTGLEPVQRGIAMVFQSYALYPHLSVYENIAFPLRLQKLSKSEVDEAVQKAAQILDLTNRLSYKPGQLSGGQRQRVAIGRAIVRDPKVFLFDEPLSNLDAALRGQMRVELSELHKKLKTTLVYVTHDQVEAMTMADRIVVLNQGKVEQFGTPMELYHKPRTRFVASFIGQPGMNFIPASIVGSEQNRTEIMLPGNFRMEKKCNFDLDLNGHSVELGIRPEALRPADGNKGLKTKIRIVERLGGVSFLYGSLEDGTSICASFDGEMDVPDEGHIILDFNPDQAHLFDRDGTVIVANE
ncbi:ABC transporter ATP-binding protein [Maritalea sp.]|uniref:ABC transporter ATP-binding protein n=1 Tax=Maritalea sp. TaxID=2003361 RepID=UPI003EF403C0